MKKILQEIAALLAAGENVVVATIFDKAGSAPRTAGAKMIVRRDGSIAGTIGGGRLEADAIRQAAKVMATGRSAVQAFNLTGADAAGMDMICGGQGEILLDYIDAGDESNRQVYREAAETLARRDKAWLITALGEGQDPAKPARQQCLVKRDGSLVGRFVADRYFLAKLTEGPAKIAIHAEVIDGQRFLVEPIRPANTAYIFGAGHVSQKIAHRARVAGNVRQAARSARRRRQLSRHRHPRAPARQNRPRMVAPHRRRLHRHDRQPAEAGQGI